MKKALEMDGKEFEGRNINVYQYLDKPPRRDAPKEAEEKPEEPKEEPKEEAEEKPEEPEEKPEEPEK